MKKYFPIFAVVIIIVLGGWVWYAQTNQKQQENNINPNPNLIAKVFYVCNEGKTIDVSYYEGPEAPQSQPGEMPTPISSVDVALSDGRKMTLPQTISASGIRYANSDESLVFFSKGNGALILEDNQRQTYIGCIQVVSDPGGLPQIYESGEQGFSIRYPLSYTVNKDYQYQGFGPGKEIWGASFTIPASLSDGTNLSSDSYIGVETIPQIQECTADLFLDVGESGNPVTNINDSGVEYSTISSIGAAAGNRYEEIIYALPGTNPCVAIRYFIHNSVFENYPPGAVRIFDRQSLINQFDSIRRTLVIVQ